MLPDYPSFARAAGFVDHEQHDHFGSVLSGVEYLMRKTPGQYEYLSLMYHEGRFLEAAYEVFLAPKQSRRPKGKDSQEKGVKYSRFQLQGYLSARATLLRDEKDLTSLLSPTRLLT